jgi:hypothetical protein
MPAPTILISSFGDDASPYAKVAMSWQQIPQSLFSWRRFLSPRSGLWRSQSSCQVFATAFAAFSHGLRRNGLGLSPSLRRFPCVPPSCKPHPMETSEPYRPLLMKFQPPIMYSFHCSAFASRRTLQSLGGASVLPKPWKRVLGLAYQDVRSISTLVFPHFGTCWKDRVLNPQLFSSSSSWTLDSNHVDSPRQRDQHQCPSWRGY